MGGVVNYRSLYLHGKRTIDYDVFLPSYGRNLQRGFVWDIEQKRSLIYSIFKGIYIPPICLVQIEHTTDLHSPVTLQIIDGKQRLSTLMSFIHGEFSIVLQGVEYYFKDLNSVNKSIVIQFDFKCKRIYSPYYKDNKALHVTDDEKLQWFKLINFAGTPQDNEHINSFVKTTT
jgi:uncharacterized protein with ParB-like and HNH nuclease domain